jgi:hypothetical protein
MDAVESPPRSSSSEKVPSGRFWALAFEDNLSSSEEEEEEGVSVRTWDYLCRSPTADVNRDLIESTSRLLRQLRNDVIDNNDNVSQLGSSLLLPTRYELLLFRRPGVLLRRAALNCRR